MRSLIYSLLAIFIFSTANAQQTATGEINGKLLTQDGKPAAYVTIFLKDTRLKTISGEDGSYAFQQVPAGNYILITSFVGLESQSRPVVMAAGENKTVDFNLKENAVELQEVIVATGKSVNERNTSIGKMPVAIRELPQSAAIVGEALIRDQQAQRLSDVIKNVNGVYLGTTRGSTQETFFARGYNLGAYNMFKNGARVNTGVMPEMSSLEKVEVLKGSAAILYGNVAPGGIVNMVTKRPKFNFGGEVSLRAGSFGLVKPSFDVYGPLSSSVAYRVNGTYETTNSYRDNVSSARYYVNPSLLFKLSGKTELTVQGDYLYSNFTPDFGIGSVLTEPNQLADLPRNAFLGTPWQYNKAQQATASVNLRHKFNDAWTLNSNVSYQQFNRDYYSIERVQIQTNGDFYRPLNKILSEENYYTAQVDVTGKFNTGRLKHVLLAGADAERYLTSTYGFTNPTVYDTINVFDAAKYVPRTDIPAADRKTLIKTPINRVGFYVQDLVAITPKLNLLAGVRWSMQESPANTTSYLLYNDSTTKGTYKADRAFSPRLGLVYKPTNSTSLFVSYASSFSPNTGTDIYFNALSPSIIDQYEAGIKNEFFNGALTANLTLYYIRNNNLAQTAQFDSSGNVNSNTNLKELVGQTGSKGIELDLAYNPAPNLNIVAGYSYNDMRYVKTPDSKGSYIEGERLVSTPQHTANGSIFYTFNTLALKGFKIGAAVFYTGKRFAGWNNTVGQTQTYSRLIPVSGFTTVDLTAGYTYKHISVLAKLSNITNTLNYYVHENYSVNPIAPRQVIATVSYRF
ncbi:TonB-dependent receptor [Panacibacter sp. DH6]|uniref:TonB-dependent receptor n=1 Tax=Panacibacter microcysteis TaxID=2793269 RepID=A0A931GXC4_9BACT|nr:TonB-dependent receptor [Panacibacter microcysteis]MBG9377803.1 TonB-dependent receptor [Panacibacter microcysteis]